MLMFDGARGYGRPVAGEAMAAAIARCRQTGVVAMTLANAHHIGRIGAYGELAIAAGLVSLHFVNVADHRGLVAPFRGTRCALLDESGLHRAARHRSAAAAAARHGHERGGDGQGPRRQERGQAARRGHPDRPARPADARPQRDVQRAARGAPAVRRPQGLRAGGGHRTARGRAVRRPDAPARERAARAEPSTTCSRCWSTRRGWPASTGSAARSTASWTTSRPRRPPTPRPPCLVPGDPERLAREERARTGIDVDATTWEEVLAAGEKVGLARSAALALIRP